MGGMVLVAASRRRTGCPDLGEDISFAGRAARNPSHQDFLAQAAIVL